MDRVTEMLRRAHEGDKAARDCLVEENMGLVHSAVKRFRGRGAEEEDLVQIGAIGLLKAVDRFDQAYNVRFSTYAVPMIIGEIRRFLRDDGSVRISRSLKETAMRAHWIQMDEEAKSGRSMTLEELAEKLSVSPEELVMALEAARPVESLYQKTYESDGRDIELIEKLENGEQEQERVVNRITVEKLMGYLNDRERQYLYLRFFRDMTQSAIAQEFDMTQVQVSRMEKKIMLYLRTKLA